MEESLKIPRWYFLTSIVVLLTIGISWGIAILWDIGKEASFTSSPIFSINAHGMAQVFGWVGLWMMGMMYFLLSHEWNRKLHYPKLAYLPLLLMVLSICIHLYQPSQANWVRISGTLRIFAVSLFLSHLFSLLKPKEIGIRFLFAGGIWLFLSTVMSAWHHMNLASASNTDILFWNVATFQAPLRDLQVHGMALFLLLGITISLFPKWFHLPSLSNRAGKQALFLLIVGLLGEVGFYLLYRFTQNHIYAAFLLLFWLGITVGLLRILIPIKIWKAPFPLFLAYLWILFSLSLLLFMPVYQMISHIVFSHAYYGAIRHAIVVGGISLMMAAIASQVFHFHFSLAALFLMNVGCLLRVPLQILSDWTPLGFSLVPISGVIEICGFGLWSLSFLFSIFARNKILQESQSRA